MGCHPNVSADTWPAQSEWVGRRVRILFHYTGPEMLGTLVRDDMEEPYETIIRLDNGHYIRGVECQWSTP